MSKRVGMDLNHLRIRHGRGVGGVLCCNEKAINLLYIKTNKYPLKTHSICYRESTVKYFGILVNNYEFFFMFC
jgi:hypothetical protein